jgi:hypothetical protein
MPLIKLAQNRERIAKVLGLERKYNDREENEPKNCLEVFIYPRCESRRRSVTKGGETETDKEATR